MPDAKPKRSDFIRARVDPELKADAEAILEQLGLTASDVIRTLYRQIVMRKGLPFELKVPNAETLAAMREVEEGGLESYPDADAMFRDMGLM